MRTGKTFQTVLLRHTGPMGTHFDWLMCDPSAALGAQRPLWTARAGVSSEGWSRLGCWDLVALEAHRLRYLTHEGPLDAVTPPGRLSRGRVVRVDAGRFTPLLWTPVRMVIDLSLRHAAGRVELYRVSGACWRARWLATRERGGWFMVFDG